MRRHEGRTGDSAAGCSSRRSAISTRRALWARACCTTRNARRSSARAFEDYATGRFSKQQILERATTAGLRNRRNQRISSQAIGMLLRNPLYAGIIDVAEYGVRDRRGDFEPLVARELFYRAQAVLSGRAAQRGAEGAQSSRTSRSATSCVAPSCGRGLTGSWSKGRSDYYAYYHCRPGCRGVNVTKGKLESLFAAELARLQPSPGYMRLLKESVVQVWKARKESVRADLADAGRRARGHSEEAGPAGRGVPVRAARSTSTSTTVTPRSCARSSPCCGSSGMPPKSTNSTWRASWRSPSASCRGRRPLGPGVTRPAPAVPTAVLSGGNCVRRLRLCWNRRNRTGVQLLAAD